MVDLSLKNPPQKTGKSNDFSLPNLDKKSPSYGIKIDTDTVPKSTPTQYLNKHRVVSNPNSDTVSKSTHSLCLNQHHHGIDINTDTVSISTHTIKHKLNKENSSSSIYNTAKHVSQKMTKKNDNNNPPKNDAILKENLVKNSADIQDAGAEKSIENSSSKIQSPPKGIIIPDLKSVEEFFVKNNFPFHEAKKFFYYNQGRKWMINSSTPIGDWQAMAHTWMFRHNEKISQTSQTNSHDRKISREDANSAFLARAKRDFHASQQRKRDNQTEVPGAAFFENE